MLIATGQAERAVAMLIYGLSPVSTILPWQVMEAEKQDMIRHSYIYYVLICSLCSLCIYVLPSFIIIEAYIEIYT